MLQNFRERQVIAKYGTNHDEVAEIWAASSRHEYDQSNGNEGDV